MNAMQNNNPGAPMPQAPQNAPHPLPQTPADAMPHNGYAPQPPMTAAPMPYPDGAPMGGQSLALQGIDLVMDYDTSASGNPAATQPAAWQMGQPLALNHANFQLGEGERVAIMGPSGSGKSTLLHVLAGITKPTAGQVLFRGANIDRIPDAERTRMRRQAFGFVFQSGQLLPELPAIENVALPLMLGGMAYSQATDQAAMWLERMGLRNLMRNRPGQMSGGQMQRVAIARALCVNPAIIFADEPTGALDQNTGHEVMNLLMQAAAANNAAVVLVTHDPNIAAYCDRTVSMRDGMILDAANRRAGMQRQPQNDAPAQAVQMGAQPQGALQ
ncbi:ABC transporter ATP-binding protein [Bifidobacterium animalis]|uniref:ABC transporter ATP-binding protein n=1 Tax=Bifidobacterium animalis TaxID=28025 RepID=UPI00101ED83D|nr:ABC transporter ATP-binding protein [Bifidobacterium animalis]